MYSIFDLISHDEQPICEDKTAIREEIKQAVTEYLKNGGKITVIERFYSSYDSATNRPKVLSDRQIRKMESLKRGSRNGNAGRIINKGRGRRD